MRKHSSWYADLPWHQKRHYSEIADEAEEDATYARQSTLCSLETELALAKERREQELNQEGVKLNLDYHRFSAADMEEMLSMYTSSRYDPGNVKPCAAKIYAPPRKPPAHVIAALGSVDIGEKVPRPTMQTHWLKCLCASRHSCMGVAFGSSLEEGSCWYVFVFATQSPLEAWFAQAHVSSMALPVYDRLSASQRRELGNVWQPIQLQLVDGVYLRDLDVRWPERDNLIVLQDLTFVGGTLCRTRGPASPLEAWVDGLVARAGASSSTARAKRPSVSDKLLEEYPWLAGYMKRLAPAGPSSAGSSSAGEDEALPEDDDELPEAAYKMVCEGLRADAGELLRGEEFFIRCRDIVSVPLGDFEPLTGTVAGEAKKGVPRQWCAQYGIAQTASFSIATHGYKNSMAFATEWCSRMRHYYLIWVAAGGGVLQYSAAELAGYKPSDAWSCLVARLPRGHVSAERAAVLNLLQPVNRP